MAAGFVVLFVVLDRSTVFFQIWSGISAWYPPAGLTFAALIAFGPAFLPVILLAEGISSIVNYKVPVLSYSFLVDDPATALLYAMASTVLRRVVKIGSDLRSVRDVMWLLLVGICSSGIVASVGVQLLGADRLVPRGQYLAATLNWWVGDAVAIGSVAPFLLIYVVPRLQQFTGLAPAEPSSAASLRVRSRHELHGFPRTLESLLFAVSIVAVIWVAL
ncbi:MAG TPA: MASE1 domain-containing protein, partial [Candidatus Acidoferrum sp.]|nr:MASE1 domain-containing protein [Candidatus Acidoferrum sp.]